MFENLPISCPTLYLQIHLFSSLALILKLVLLDSYLFKNLKNFCYDLNLILDFILWSLQNGLNLQQFVL